jgi:hypothetical protein
MKTGMRLTVLGAALVLVMSLVNPGMLYSSGPPCPGGHAPAPAPARPPALPPTAPKAPPGLGAPLGPPPGPPPANVAAYRIADGDETLNIPVPPGVRRSDNQVTVKDGTPLHQDAAGRVTSGELAKRAYLPGLNNDPAQPYVVGGYTGPFALFPDGYVKSGYPVGGLSVAVGAGGRYKVRTKAGYLVEYGGGGDQRHIRRLTVHGKTKLRTRVPRPVAEGGGFEIREVEHPDGTTVELDANGVVTHSGSAGSRDRPRPQ